MKLTNSIVLVFSDGYFEVQHEKVAEKSGNVYLSDKKTFANASHLLTYLAPYGVTQELLEDAVKKAKLEAGINQAKSSRLAKERLKGDL